MSSNVPLYFYTRESADGKNSIRLIAWLSFKSGEGYLAPMRAIIDTGAPVSLIPFKVWGQCNVTMEQSFRLPSISERPECDLEITQGKITFSLLNEQRETIIEDLTIDVDLCHTSEMPILLGWHDFLSRGRLYTDYASSEAWLQIRHLA